MSTSPFPNHLNYLHEQQVNQVYLIAPRSRLDESRREFARFAVLSAQPFSVDYVDSYAPIPDDDLDLLELVGEPQRYSLISYGQFNEMANQLEHRGSQTPSIFTFALPNREAATLFDITRKDPSVPRRMFELLFPTLYSAYDDDNNRGERYGPGMPTPRPEVLIAGFADFIINKFDYTMVNTGWVKQVNMANYSREP